VADPVSAPLFPRTIEAYCVDPQGETRTYGEQAKLTLDDVCTTAFDGDCAVYNQLGLKRLVSMRYVDGAGGEGTADVYLSRFADATGAFAMYSKRVVGDADPAEPTTPKPLAAGAAGALGTGRAYVWKDSYLVELQYNNEQETPEALARSSARALTAIGMAIGSRLPGSSDLPPPVAALPPDHRIVNGVQLVAKDALGLTGLGPLAVGYYEDGGKRFRLVSLVAADEAKAREAWKIVRARPGAAPVPSLGDEAVAVTLAALAPGAPARDYVFARKGTLVVGAGDEELGAAGSDRTTRLSREQKMARVRVWLATLPAGLAKGPEPKK
jgi:hypothetical protein